MTRANRILIGTLATLAAGVTAVGCATGPASGAGSLTDPPGSGGRHVPAASRCSVDRPHWCRMHVFPPHGRCFPVGLWNADDTKLPCVEVRRVYEDGSFTVAVLDGDGTVRYTRGVGVPNAYEAAQR